MTPSISDPTFGRAPSIARTMGNAPPTFAPQIPPGIFGGSVLAGNDDMPVWHEDPRPPFTLPPVLLAKEAPTSFASTTPAMECLTPSLLVAVLVLFSYLRWM